MKPFPTWRHNDINANALYTDTLKIYIVIKQTSKQSFSLNMDSLGAHAFRIIVRI